MPATFVFIFINRRETLSIGSLCVCVPLRMCVCEWNFIFIKIVESSTKFILKYASYVSVVVAVVALRILGYNYCC